MSQVATAIAVVKDVLAWPALPEPSAALREMLRLLEVEGPDHLRRFNVVPEPSQVDEVSRLLVVYDATFMAGALARDRLSTVEEWLKRLNRGLSRPETEKGLQTMLTAVATASGDLPIRCFNRDTLAEAMRRVHFLGAKAVDDVLRPHSSAMGKVRYALKAVVAAKPKIAPEAKSGAEPSADEREAILADFRQRMAREGLDRPVASSPQGVLPKPRPSYLSTGQLLAVYEAEAKAGSASAATRVAYLRAQLAGQAGQQDQSSGEGDQS